MRLSTPKPEKHILTLENSVACLKVEDGSSARSFNPVHDGMTHQENSNNKGNTWNQTKTCKVMV